MKKKKQKKGALNQENEKGKEKYKKLLEDKEKELKENKEKIEIYEKKKNELLKSIEEKNEQILKAQIEKNNNEEIIKENKKQLEKYKKKNNEYKSKITEYENQLEEYKKEITKSQQIKFNNQNLAKQQKLFEQEMKKQKQELEIIKIEYEKSLKEKYDKNYENEVQKFSEQLKKEYEDKIKEMEKKFEENYKFKENQMQMNYKQMSNLLEKKIENYAGSKINLSICNTRHNGIKCEQCFKNPIVGYRYKCSICDNYNLCENCEEENSKSQAHTHNFIKIRNAEQSINNNFPKNNKFDKFPKENIIDNDGINNDAPFHNSHKEDNNNYSIKYQKEDININNNDDKEEFNIFNKGEEEEEKENEDEDEENLNKEYSFECINRQNLVTEIMDGDSEAKISVTLKNVGKKTWPKEHCNLVFDYNSNFAQNDIQLSPQKCNEIKNYEVCFNNLDQYPAGEYKSVLYFEINGERIGEPIEIKLIIKEFNNDYSEKLNLFRNDFSLSKNDYSDERLLEALKKHNFNFEDSFSSLFG